MKVLVVSRSTPGHRIGGLETYVHDMLTSLSDMGINTRLITADGASEAYLRGLATRGIKADVLKSVPSVRYTPAWYRALAEVRFSADVVIFHGLAGIKSIASPKGPRLVTLTHGAMPLALYNAGLDAKPVRPRLSRTATYLTQGELRMLWTHDLVALSSYDARWTRLSSGGKGGNVVVIPPAISPASMSLPRNNSILFAGRLTKSKGLGDVLGAWRTIDRRGFRLRIAGSGPMADDNGRFDIEGVDFLGPQSGEQVRAEMASARWSVVGGRYLESFGLSAAESMAEGTPVAYRARGALTETVGAGGLPFSSRRSLVDALETAIHMDIPQWTELSRDALTRAAEFDPSRIRKQWMEYLER